MGGWVTFPGGQFERDPGSAVSDAPSYDWPLRRWVPVGSASISPDGTKYVASDGSTFFLVDVVTGKRRPIFSTPGNRAVVDYTSEGVYLADPGGQNPRQEPGLWLLDPAIGNVRLIPGSEQSAGWQLVSRGVAWALPSSSHSVLRLDLRSGQIDTWYRFPTSVALQSVSLRTMDAGGQPLVSVYPPYPQSEPSQFGLITGRDQFQELQVPVPAFKAYLAQPGIWLTLNRGADIELYTPEKGVILLSTATHILGVAGGCFDAANNPPLGALWRAVGD